MMPRRSLRLRLLFLLLVPLSLISVGAVTWRYIEARETAQELFDRNLLITAFAVARDVALSDGDSLSPETRQLLGNASGTNVFYHVRGPDGSFVTGYSLPPVSDVPDPSAPIQQYDGRHQGEPVRVSRLLEQTAVDGISGTSVVTVWQRLDQRDAFIRRVARQASVTVLLLLASVASLVLWGVGLGLKPLAELEDAIQKRSSTDLGPIVRPVPVETKGIVSRLNSLFAKVTDAQKAQQRFVSLAAHQLRNPIAAIHTLAEATYTAKTLTDTRDRAEMLLKETRAAMRLTNQLLSFERIRGTDPKFTEFDLSALLQDVAQQVAPRAIDANIRFDLDIGDVPLTAYGDAVLLREAIANLLDNALTHGGPDMTYVRLSAGDRTNSQDIDLSVENDGKPLEPQDATLLFERFAQGDESHGAGLGLSIAKTIVESHGGRLELTSSSPVLFQFALKSRPAVGPSKP